MNFIRENETKYILSTYKSMTPKKFNGISIRI